MILDGIGRGENLRGEGSTLPNEDAIAKQQSSSTTSESTDWPLAAETYLDGLLAGLPHPEALKAALPTTRTLAAARAYGLWRAKWPAFRALVLNTRRSNADLGRRAKNLALASAPRMVRQATSIADDGGERARDRLTAQRLVLEIAGTLAADKAHAGGVTINLMAAAFGIDPPPRKPTLLEGREPPPPQG